MVSSHFLVVYVLALVAVLATCFPAKSPLGPQMRGPRGAAPPAVAARGPQGRAKDLEGAESYWGGYGGWGYGGWGYGGWGYGGFGYGGWGYGGWGYPYWGGYFGGYYPWGGWGWYY